MAAFTDAATYEGSRGRTRADRRCRLDWRPSVYRDAGEPVAVSEGAQLTLNATATDADEDIMTYSWRHDSSLEMILTDADSLAPSFTAPQVHGNTTITFTLTADDGMENGTDTVQVTVLDEPANNPPSVDAGEPVAVSEGAQVTLNATASDQDGDQLTYSWRHDSSLEIILTDADSLAPSFTAPQVRGNTTITFTLTADDGMENGTDTVQPAVENGTDTVQVTVLDEPANNPPSVDAGEPVAVSEGAQVTLNATASDQDGDQLTYSWRHDSALGISLANAASLSPTFTAPQVSANTTVAFTLTADDGTDTHSDTVTVTILDVPVVGTPNGGSGQNTTAVLNPDGPLGPRDIGRITLTSDTPGAIEAIWVTPSEAPAGYRISWAQVGDPYLTWTDSTGNAFPTDPSRTITGLEEGIEYKAKVRATYAGTSGDWSGEITITVARSANNPPTADAGTAQTVQEGDTVTLSATASDQDGDQLTYSWRHDSSLEMILTGADSLAPSFTAPQVRGNTTITFTLTADDGMENGTDTVQVTVLDEPANSPPSVDAGEPVAVSEGAQVTINATASDQDGDQLTYSWNHDSALGISLANAASLSPTFTAPQVSANTTVAFTLTADDGTDTRSDTVTVTILDVLASNQLDSVNTTQSIINTLWRNTVVLDPPEQRGPRDIGRITLTSGAPGAIEASWVAPSETPAGYRISWAQVGDPYLTWTDSTGNAFPTDPSRTITGLEEGTEYKAKMRATYGGTSGDWSGEITITVARSANSPPSVDAGEPVAVNEGAQVTLNATASDQDGDQLTYSWSHDSSLEIILTDADSLAPSFTAPQVHGNTTITFTLTADDGMENGTDTVQVTVLDEPANSPPSVDAGGDQTVGEDNTVTLSGSATDPNGDPITYTWSQTGPAAPLITFANASAPSTTFVAPSVTGDTTFTLVLTANDGTQHATDTLNVTVKETGAAFVTTWTASNSDRSITLPMRGTYSILWGDGSHDENVSGSRSHTYGAAGTYTVTVLGNGLEYIRLYGDTANASQLKSIEQWGDTKWTSMHEAFYGARNMVYRATDTPDLSGVTDMNRMFYGASFFNGDLSSWDVSSVTDMSSVFPGASSFNGDLSSWDVSSVTDMYSMFSGASSFNGDLSSWDVSSVADMYSMFSGASSFNGNISSWDVSSITDTSWMFYDATVFNQPLDGWNVSSVTAMDRMFLGAIAFNQPLDGWDVSSVTAMDRMFLGTPSFNQNLGTWYIVPADTDFDAGGDSLIVTTISAQNPYLRDHSPTYGMGSGGDSDLFEMTGPTLAFRSAPEVGSYTAIVTASGGNVFENGNNWMMLEITVHGSANSPPTA